MWSYIIQHGRPCSKRIYAQTSDHKSSENLNRLLLFPLMEELISANLVNSLTNLLSIIIVVMLILVFLGFIGTFADYARRAGVIIRSRIRLIVTPFIYSIISLASIVVVLYFSVSHAIANPLELISSLISQGIGSIVFIIIVIFILIIAIGALTIYAINRSDLNFSRAFVLSLALTFSLLIDFIWAVVTGVVASMINPFLYLGSMVVWEHIPSISPAVWYGIIGILLALLIVIEGPSSVIAGVFYTVSGLSFLIIGFLIIYSFFFPPLLLLAVPFMIILFVIGIITLIISLIIGGLGIVRAIGLLLIILSLALIFSAGYVESSIMEITSSPLISSLIPQWLTQGLMTIFSLIKSNGLLAIFLGFIFLIVGRREEGGQLMSVAMGIAFATASLIIIFFSQLFTIELGTVRILGLALELGKGMLAFLIFPLLVTLLYPIALNILRIILAIKWLISPPK